MFRPDLGYSTKTPGSLPETLVFRFDQKSTSVISLLSLASAMFRQQRGGSGSSLSQLLVIISDGRGIFHEGRDKVLQVSLSQ